MWPFRRKQQDDLENVPSEIKEYYQAEQRERMGLAWLLAAVTLVATVGIVLGLFLGGRFVYHRLAHKNKAPVVTTQPDKTPTAVIEKPSSTPKTTPKVTAPPKNNKKVAVSPSPVTTKVKPQQANPRPTTITNTGPSGTLAAFIGASAVGFMLYELNVRRKLTD